jgi:hypothetical protein
VRRRQARGVCLALALAVLAASSGPDSAAAAESPQVVSSSVEGVASTAATLRASLNPGGAPTAYRFEYLTQAAYEANLAAGPPRDPFQGAALAPLSGAGGVGSGTTAVVVSQRLAGLAPATAYRYRVRASNMVGTTFGPPRPFATQAATNVFELLDDRGWEMVSPIDKNGGSITPPEAVADGGVFQAAAGGGALTYSSADSFGGDAQGAPAGSQYVALRGTGGWSSVDITTPLLSGSYGDNPDGVPYQLFSPDLSLGLLSNGERCRGGTAGDCPVANPPLPGSGAPPGYRNYYLRQGADSYRAILSGSALMNTSLGPEQLELAFAAASSDLSQVLVTACAALTANATEVSSPGGCEADAQNLYRWSEGSLTLVNLLPEDTVGTPGAAAAAQSSAVSDDGSRVYWSEDGHLYLREGTQTKQVDDGLAAAVFETASSDGSVAYLTAAGNLYRYAAAADQLTPLVSDGSVKGVLGAAADGSKVYYLTTAGLFFYNGSTSTQIATAADASNYPPATGTARVTADGAHLAFLSSAELTGFQSNGQPEVFLYGPLPGGGARLVCVSCAPTGELPSGPASIPGAIANGAGPGATDLYKPRALSSDGHRVFFDSADALVLQDTNKRTDVYEWEAEGIGNCAHTGGCLGLISNGRSPEASTFIDADSDGSDAYFLTSASLDPNDPGSYDIYDARVGGGFATPIPTIPCIGDACQVLPEAPEDPTPGTLTPNSGNPPLRIVGGKGKKAKKKKAKHHKKKKPRQRR